MSTDPTIPDIMADMETILTALALQDHTDPTKAMTAKVIYFHVSGIPTVDQSLITYSNMDTGFTHDSTGKMVEVTGAMIHFSTWSKSQFRAYQLGRNVLRGVKQWPPYRRIDQLRSALTDRISDSATAQGTATVDVDDLTALTTALTGQTRDAKMERVAEAYTLLRELEDDLENLSATASDAWLTGLNALRLNLNVLGVSLLMEKMSDSPRGGLYEKQLFEQVGVMHYVRSDT